MKLFDELFIATWNISSLDVIYTMCAILDNATLKCWGRSQYGQMGKGDTNSIGNTTGQMGDNLVAIDLGGTVGVLQVAAGDQNCALLATGDVKCWGHNNAGQLGYGNTNDLGDNAGEMGNNLNAVDLAL